LLFSHFFSSSGLFSLFLSLPFPFLLRTNGTVAFFLLSAFLSFIHGYPFTSSVVQYRFFRLIVTFFLWPGFFFLVGLVHFSGFWSMLEFFFFWCFSVSALCGFACYCGIDWRPAFSICPDFHLSYGWLFTFHFP